MRPGGLKLKAVATLSDVQKFCSDNFTYQWFLTNLPSPSEDHDYWTAMRGGAEKDPYVDKDKKMVIFTSTGLLYSKVYPEMLNHAKILKAYMRQPEGVTSAFGIPLVSFLFCFAFFSCLSFHFLPVPFG
uniref:Uncharacterized protein n=1 Tax=Chromera velia CCMP2878 TaxID=1169474 RepID=A0A0G4FG63_9ALVE|eukprot:Cvel_3299.t1-p1 / transcript=Cvel_3299.t1 / gene=Cvel_3299 / organism=Chromera_velia_CCMP2878 / gene_product=hypothetical protein / transcript_product=hypothetical protein / location=Cvel_scaffold130:109973-110356(+) / protein_length=128 / sequence_SO=supercontig / SO=protein_coding / is_pseudo=false